MTLRNRGEPPGSANVASRVMAVAMRRANRQDLVPSETSSNDDTADAAERSGSERGGREQDAPFARRTVRLYVRGGGTFARAFSASKTIRFTISPTGGRSRMPPAL